MRRYSPVDAHAGGWASACASTARRGADPRDYDVEHYARILRANFAARLNRALAPEDFAAVFADPHQLSLFTPPTDAMRPILTPLSVPGG